MISPSALLGGVLGTAEPLRTNKMQGMREVFRALIFCQGPAQRIEFVDILQDPLDGLFWHLSPSVASECAEVRVAFTLLRVPQGLILDLDGNGQTSISFPVVNIQQGTFGGIKEEPHLPSCLEADVQHLLELVKLAREEE